MRDSRLVKKRDEKLVKEFHRLYDVERLRIEDVLDKLSESFFLDPTYIYNRIFYNVENKELYYSLSQ